MVTFKKSVGIPSLKPGSLVTFLEGWGKILLKQDQEQTSVNGIYGQLRQMIKSDQ